ncbi:glycosyltransferase family 4 protein [Thermostilla marina]
MHILFLTHYFPPEVNAPATRTYEHCVRWVKAGHRVTVITCNPNHPKGVIYPGYRNRLRAQRDVVDGIEVVRVWTLLAPNAGTVRRILNFLSYMVAAIIASFRIRKVDVVVATSPQFFCGWAGVWVSRLKRRPFVLEIRDIWPESIETVGAIRFRPILRFLEFLERRMYLAADHIVAVGEGYKQKILEKVPLDDRISVVTNGVDLDKFRPTPPDRELRARWNAADSTFVCAYVGTIGMAHGLEVVIEAADILRTRGDDRFVFWLVGDGARREELQRETERRGLTDRVLFTGSLPKEEMPRVIASADACLVHLRGTELFGTVIPSKIFEMMAMERPIIMGVRGEARRIVVDEAQAGVAMEPDSPESLIQCLERLATNPRSKLNGRDYLADHFDRNKLAHTYISTLLSLPTQSTHRSCHTSL